jgi:hypothetical protein
LPYSTALSIATDGNTLYTACKEAFFTYTPSARDMKPYSKVEGMSEIGMLCLNYDLATSTAVLCYGNGNIDLFKDNTFYNIPDLKIKTIAGDKTVYEVNTLNGMAYLSSAQGIIVIDLARKEIEETYQLIESSQVLKVKSFVSKGDSFYAATSGGIYAASRNSPALQNSQVWKKVNVIDSVNKMTVFNDVLYVATSKTVYTLNGGMLQPVFSVIPPNTRIQHIDAGKNSLYISSYDDTSYQGYVRLMNPSQQISDSFRAPVKPVQVVELLDGTVWIADAEAGMHKREGNGAATFVPFGPADSRAFDVYAHNQDLYIAHGGYSDNYLGYGSGSGFSHFKDGKWTFYKRYSFPPIDEVPDISVLLKDEKSGTVYAGSYYNGLFILNADGTTELINDQARIDHSQIYSYTQASVMGLGLDKKGTLWVSPMGTNQHQLSARSAEGTWYKFSVPGVSNGGQLTIDDDGKVWFVNTQQNGVSVYDAGDLADPADDSYYHLIKGAGSGNLPSNNVYCIAKDKNDNIWIGTDNGIGIASHCNAPFNQAPPCDAERPIVQYDKFAGYLFDGNTVRSIAVDGANRKWVGTDDGVWLLSPHAEKIIYRFTVDNSPLPSSRIRKISIDDVTGDVYISTDMGLVCFRSTATEGGDANENVLTFPNPVPANYTGTIAIKGLVENADVRITDINGQLVYHTKALGGQAVWNGLDYKGHKPQSGVYLIFVTNADGSQTYTGKMVFLN